MKLSLIPFVDAINHCQKAIGDDFFRAHVAGEYDPQQVMDKISSLIDAAEAGDSDAEHAAIKLATEYFDTDTTSALAVRLHAIADNHAAHRPGYPSF